MTHDVEKIATENERDADFVDYDIDEECCNCGGEGYVFGCGWDWQCNTYDAGEGTCLCARRCEICNPPKLTPKAIAEREELRQLLARSINEATQALQEQDNG